MYCKYQESELAEMDNSVNEMQVDEKLDSSLKISSKLVRFLQTKTSKFKNAKITNIHVNLKFRKRNAENWRY